MEERNIDIEKWLQQAAARQEQEQTAPAEKQEAWDAMLGMLDQPAVPRHRFRWRFWLGGVLLLGIVVYFMLPEVEVKKSVTDSAAVEGLDRGKDQLRMNGSGEAKDGLGVNEGITNAEAEMDEGKVNGQERSGENKVTAKEGAEMGEGKVNGKERSGENKVRANTGAEMREGKADGKDGLEKNKDKMQPDDEKDKGKTEKTAYGGKHNPRLNENKRVPPPALSAQIVPWQTIAMAQRKTSNITLLPASSIPRPITEPDAALSRSTSGIPYRPVTRGKDSYAASGFSARVGGILPVNGAYGANIAAEYTFSFFNRLKLRPYAGAGYLTGFDKSYQHTAFYARPLGSGPGRVFMIDSIVTNFRATSLWFGEGGLQVAYAHKRWELMAGIGYQRVFRANGTVDSTFKTLYDSVHAPNYQAELFSKGTLPGVGKLIVQAGINYMITPQLQAGVRYNRQVQASRAGRGYGFDPRSGSSADSASGYKPVLPLQSSLEIQVRWYFRRKKN